MAIYTVSPDLLRNIEKDEGIYFTDILFTFTQRANLFKVSQDKKGIVINTYRTIKENGDIIKFWLEMMSFKPSPFETIEVDISDIECETTQFIKVCKETKDYNKIVFYSMQNLDEKFECKEKVLIFENVNINVLDRDDAKEELSQKIKSITNISKTIIQKMDQKNYKAEGNIGAFGENATASNFTQNNLEYKLPENFDYSKLSEELQALKNYLQNNKNENDEEHLDTISAVIKAEKASNNKDENGVIGFLKKASKWSLDAATQIGTSLAAEIIKKSAGL